ncbi:MAG: hypothetical protein IJ855_06285, partial [Bacteroidales bacterium]|nr:hypothetical protein [Bacteroidales bacterium]
RDAVSGSDPRHRAADLARYGVRPLKQAQNFCRYYQKAFAELKEKVYSEPDFKSCRDKDFKLYKSGNEMV